MATQPAGATVVAPATPAVPNPTSPVDPNTMIPLTLSVGQINMVLQILGTRPLGEVLDLYGSIRSQGDMAIAAMRMSGALQPVEAPKVEQPARLIDPPPADTRRQRRRS